MAKKSSRGQALVEFTLFVVVLLLLVGVAVDAGRLYVVYQTLQEGTREGAIYGAIAAGQDEEIKKRVVLSSANLHLEMSDVTVTYLGEACADGDNLIQVSAVKEVTLVAPLTSLIVGHAIHLQATERALIIAPACP